MSKLMNQLSTGVSRDPVIVELYDRLLWLSNHYDVGDPKLKKSVLKIVDRTLEKVSGIKGGPR